MCQLIVITADSDPQCNVTFIKCLRGVWVGDFFKSSAVNRLCWFYRWLHQRNHNSFNALPKQDRSKWHLPYKQNNKTNNPKPVMFWGFGVSALSLTQCKLLNKKTIPTHLFSFSSFLLLWSQLPPPAQNHLYKFVHMCVPMFVRMFVHRFVHVYTLIEILPIPPGCRWTADFVNNTKREASTKIPVQRMWAKQIVNALFSVTADSQGDKRVWSYNKTGK